MPGLHIDATTMAVMGHNRTYSGVTGLREWVADTSAPFDGESRFEIEEVVALGDDVIVLKERLIGHGAHSGAALELRWVSVRWFRAGRVARGAGYLSRRAALQAAGLSE